VKWKQELRQKLPGLFSGNKDPEEKDKAQLVDNLYKRIGQLEMKNNWLYKW